MTTSDREKLSQYFDGELPPEEAAGVAAQEKNDPRVHEALARWERMGSALKQHASQADETPMSASLQATVEALQAPMQPRPTFDLMAKLASWVTMPRMVIAFATAVIAIVAVAQLSSVSTPPAVAPALVAALDSAADNAVDPTGTIETLTSFTDAEGRLCRTYDLPQDGLSGLACAGNSAGSWVVIAEEPLMASTGAQLASGSDNTLTIADRVADMAPVGADDLQRLLEARQRD